jgi:hypothetical protein
VRAPGLGEGLAELKARWSDLGPIDVNEIRAGDLAVKHALRGFDAVHLAAAMDLRDGVGKEPMTFATFDGRRGRAARAEGFAVVPEPRPLGARSRPSRPLRRSTSRR